MPRDTGLVAAAVLMPSTTPALANGNRGMMISRTHGSSVCSKRCRVSQLSRTHPERHHDSLP